MGISPDALYSCLLIDLAANLGREVDYKSIPQLWPDASSKEAACFSIAKSFLKKYEVKNSSLHDSRALLKFLQVNSACGNWKLQLETSWDEVLFGELRRAIDNFLYPEGNPICDSLDQSLHYGRCGPGAAVDARGGDFYTKLFSSTLSCTSRGLYIAYRNYIRNFPEWANAELIRQANFGDTSIVEGNRLSFVPKNDQISRTICIEPNLNMFIQLGFGHIIERRLASCYGISMAMQPTKNRELARRGSLGLGLVTIDLSSASDSMSLRMLRTVLPKYFFDMLCFLRSKTTDIPGLGPTRLEMVSTMGNGFTFPLQTMLFSCIVMAAFRARQVQPVFPRGAEFGNFGVFGDDIICPDSISKDVFRLLGILGFQINHEKTFVEGPFRESCGSDYFRGLNIRGVYVKRLGTIQDRVSVINQLNLFSTRTGISLPVTVQSLLRKVPWCPVPSWENANSGIHVPFSLVRRPRLDPDLSGSVTYWRYEPIGLRIRLSESGLWVPKKAKPRIYNPSGLFISFLQRSINSWTIGVRHDITRFKRKLCVAPSWDNWPSSWTPANSTQTVLSFAERVNWQRWNTAVYLNFYS